MKILVIDDKAINLKAAMAQLGKDHEVEIASSFDEGRKLILEKEFDVVLTDLMMCGGECSTDIRDKSILEQEMPVGIFLALLASTKGVKKVGLLTDMNHHLHPASAALDDFRQMLKINNSEVILSNFHAGMAWFMPDNLSVPLSFNENGVIRVKCWPFLMEKLGLGDLCSCKSLSRSCKSTTRL